MAHPNPESQFQDIWISAIEKYKQDTKTDPLEGRLEAFSPDALFKLIDEQLDTVKDSRKIGEKVRNAIKPVLELVNTATETLGESLAAVFPPAKAVSVAVRVLLKDVSANYDMIIEMFEELKGFIGRLGVHNREEIAEPLKKVIVEILAQLLVVLGVATKWIKQGRPTKYSMALLGKNKEVTDAMETLRRLSNQEVPMVAAVILATTTKTFQNMQAITDNVSMVARVVEASRDDALREKIRSWLKPLDPTTNYNTAIEARQKGTGDWFLQGPDFLNWRITPSSLLWINGIPGNGKTILCSTVIEALEGYRRKDRSVAVAYFYFDFNEPGKLLYRKMVHSLIFQLWNQCPGGPDALKDLYERTHNGSQQPNLDALLDVLKVTVGLFSQTFIVLDALDESTGSERKKILEFLTKIMSWKTQTLHVLSTSRVVPGIEGAMQSLCTDRIDLCGQNFRIKQDIRSYLDDLLQDDGDLREWGTTEKVMITTALVERSGGMFQWVRCQLDTLRKCLVYADLETALECLPKTLDATYERILRNIPDEHQDMLHRILQFLCFSERPMTLGEVAEVVTVTMDSEGKVYYSGRHLRKPSDVLAICGSLVTLSAEKATWNFSRRKTPLESQVIRVSHFSVKEFLMSERIRTGAFDYGVNAKLAHGSIAMTCLAYLMRFNTDVLDVKRMKTERDVALAPYAARHWVNHFQQQGPNTHWPLQDLVQQFFHFPRQQHFLNWVRMYDYDVDKHGFSLDRRRHPNAIPDPLYYSCNLGLLDISNWLLTEGAEVNAKGGYWGSPLQAASYKGHEAIVRLLLDGGVEPNAKGGECGNALQAASHEGHKAIVKLLLDRGAKVNAQQVSYGNALHSASQNGHADIVRLLLDRGAKVNAQGGIYDKALLAASVHDHEAIVQLLLDRGAQINGRVLGHYGNALHAASVHGREAIVQLLLDRGAEVNVRGGNYGNALQAASKSGHEAVVQLLLDRGAEANAQGGMYGNALQAASYQGHEVIVRLLLDRGANVNAQGKEFGTALQAASFGGHEAIVRLLIDRGAKINVQGREYDEALITASQHGHEVILQLLLDLGAKLLNEPGEGVLSVAPSEVFKSFSQERRETQHVSADQNANE